MHVDISVIIPHKNNPQLLQQCLDSIPVRENIEVIVVDDNSSVECVDFDNFPGRGRVGTTVLFTSHGGGAGYARNEGLKVVRGRWLLFADCDDYFAPDAFDILLQHTDSKADIVYFKSVSKEASAKTLRIDTSARYNRYIDAYLADPTERNANMLRYHNEVPWGKLIRRQMIEENDIRFDEIRWSNDTLFSIRAAIAARDVEICADTIYTYVQHEGSLIHQESRDSFLCRYDVQLRRWRLLRDNKLPRYICYSDYTVRRLLSYPKHSFRYGLPMFFTTVRMLIKCL